MRPYAAARAERTIDAMRKLAVAFAVAAALWIGGASSAFADTMPAPGGGPAFGQHVAMMSPGNGGMTGPAFGTCVSTMASQGVCGCPGSGT